MAYIWRTDLIRALREWKSILWISRGSKSEWVRNHIAWNSRSVNQWNAALVACTSPWLESECFLHEWFPISLPPLACLSDFDIAPDFVILHSSSINFRISLFFLEITFKFNLLISKGEIFVNINDWMNHDPVIGHHQELYPIFFREHLSG